MKDLVLQCRRLALGVATALSLGRVPHAARVLAGSLTLGLIPHVAVASAQSVTAARPDSSQDPRAAEADATEFAALFARAETGDVGAERVLLEIGVNAAEYALRDFAAQGITARRLRAIVLERAGDASGIAAAIRLLGDPDPLVRETLVRFLARPELGLAAAPERIDALATVARDDADEAVRGAAATALSAIDDDQAAVALDSLLDGAGGSERARLATLLSSTVRGRPRALQRLAQAARGAENAEVFAALLVPCARAAADRTDGFGTPLARAPILAGLRHPDVRVRTAARTALDQHISRRVSRQDFQGAIAVLAEFERDGFDTCRTLEERARLALLAGTRDEEGREYARALDGAARAKDTADLLAWRARAAHLEALALLGQGAADGAAEPLARACAWIDARLAARVDSTGKDGARAHVQLLYERACLAVTSAAREIALELPPEATLASAQATSSSAPSVLESLRTAHLLALEAQAVSAHHELDSPRSFDIIWHADVGVHDLLLDVPRRAAWPPERLLALRVLLGRAFATVAPLESLGFEPFPGVARELGDPHADPARRGRLIDALDAECDSTARELAEARRKILREPWGGIEPEQLEAALIAENRFQDAIQSRRRVEDGDTTSLAEMRTPSWYVVWLARALRDEGHPAEARPFLLAARAQLDASEVAQRYLWGPEMTAEIEMMLGGSLSDDGDPARAELELMKAERRLAALEESLRGLGASPTTLAIVRNQRCGALVALAVNANVKMHDPVKAVAWFEAAYEIRQDDFMRVLLACYRARQGRTHEARALVREVTPSPGTYYNLACTWALLGEPETALSFLKRDLDENYPSAGALKRQRDWARTDPDLESLRDDARFRALVEDKR